MPFRTLDDIDLAGKRVLVRVDINVPMRDGRVTDATRMEAIRPTVHEIVEQGGRPILLAHFGRPKGKPDPEMSLGPLAPTLSQVLGLPVEFAPDCIGAETKTFVETLPQGSVLLLENTRFHKGEEANDPGFADELARIGDVYVNDAFSAAHRAHASTEGIARLLPSAAGRLMQAELQALERALTSAGAPGDRSRRRRQGLDQARPARQPARQGGPDRHRRRHGQHLPARPRRRNRPLAGRAGPGRHGAPHRGQRRGARLHAGPADRRGLRARTRRGRRRPARSRRTPARPT